MGSFARDAPNAPPDDAKKPMPASPSASKANGHAGSATTADGKAAWSPGKLSDAAVDYAASRGISRATLERLGAGSGTTFFPRRLRARSEAVVFPYTQDGEVVNWKACAFPEKDFIGKKGGKLCFLGLDDVLAAEPGDVWFVEGEWDRAAFVEAGIPLERVLSVPSGAQEQADMEAEKPAGYDYVDDALRRGLGKHKRFIWAGDGDAAGLVLRGIMARLLGQAKFWFVEWPEGIKDGNQFHLSDGPEALRELVTEGMMQWPVAGLYSLRELPEPARIETWRVPHMPGWSGKIRLAPGMLSVVTGHPGHGKTALWAQIWHDVAAEQDLVVAVASFETRAKPHFRRILRTLQAGTLERDLSDEQCAGADRWINAHYRWIVHPDQRPTLTWLLDVAEVAVARHGARIVQLDPFNRLESQREPGERETDYIGRCLTAAYTFAVDLGVHVQILAHPAKMDGRRRGGPPELEDIAGSKHFDNRVDQGFVVHRPKMFDGPQPRTEALIYQKKARFEELGYPCRLAIKFDYRTGRFVETEGE